MEHKFRLKENNNDMFCRIYVAGTTISYTILINVINNLLEAQLVENRYIEKEGYSIEIRSNDEYDAVKQKIFPDGFLYFPIFIEIEIDSNISKVEAATEVSKILKFLWGNNNTAIASCDFEELLPEKGGFKSLNIPWPR